jgi:hypothetical protein
LLILKKKACLVPLDFKAIYPVTAKDGTEQMKVDTLVGQVLIKQEKLIFLGTNKKFGFLKWESM